MIGAAGDIACDADPNGPDEPESHLALKLAAAVLFFDADPIVDASPKTPALADFDFLPDLLGLDESFKLPHLLQGGTWSAGRDIARKLRPPDGPSPIPVASDGTVF